MPPLPSAALAAGALALRGKRCWEMGFGRTSTAAVVLVLGEVPGCTSAVLAGVASSWAVVQLELAARTIAGEGSLGFEGVAPAAGVVVELAAVSAVE